MHSGKDNIIWLSPVHMNVDEGIIKKGKLRKIYQTTV